MSDKQNEKAQDAFNIDEFVSNLFEETTLVRPEPTIPTVSSVEILEEKNSKNQINGVNLAIALTGVPVILGRLIENVDGKWQPIPTNMTNRLVDKRYGNQKALANVVTIRFGTQDDPKGTYFAVDVPSVTEITKFAQKICDAMNEHGLEAFEKKGLLIRLSDEAQAVVQIDMSRFANFRLYNFCTIGKDGKPVLDLTQNWSLHRQPGRATVQRLNTDGSVEIVKNFKPSFRGDIYSRGDRSTTVAKGIAEQIEKQVGKDLAKIAGTPYEARERTSNTSRQDAWKWRTSNRFASQAPEQEQESTESKTQAPANAGDLEF